MAGDKHPTVSPHFNNVCMQPDELEEGIYEFESFVWGERHHTLPPPEPRPLPQRPPRPSATSGGCGHLQNIQKEKEKLLDVLVAKLATATNVQRAEIMETIHPDILGMMLKRMKELNSPPIPLPPPEPPTSRISGAEDYSHHNRWDFDTNNEEDSDYYQNHCIRCRRQRHGFYARPTLQRALRQQERQRQ